MKEDDPLINASQEREVQSKVSRAAAWLVSLVCMALPLIATAQSSQPPASDAASESALGAKLSDPRHHETWATCQVLMWINAKGQPQAAQVINPHGSLLLEQSCLNFAIGQKLRPISNAQEGAYRWEILDIKWMDPHTVKKSVTRSEIGLPVPELALDQTLRLDLSYYPAAALKSRKDGVCAIHAWIDASGNAESVTITRSTGTPELDSACLEAIRVARFKPARRDDQNVSASTDVWLRWMLP